MSIIAITANTSWYIFNFRRNTIISLLLNGHTVVAIAPEDEYSPLIKELGCDFINIKIDQGGANPLRDMQTIFAFFSIYRSRSIDAVLNFTPKNNIYSTLAAKIFDVKVINNIAGLGSLFINENLTTKVAKFLYKFSQQYADKVFFQNEEDRAVFLENKMVIESITERLPGSGADLNRFRVTMASDDGVVRFLLVARMLYDKGIKHYVDAARVLKLKYGSKVEFKLLGFLDVNNPSAVSKERMTTWVDEGIINYLGISNNVELEIAKVDCMVLPSFYREGVPKSLLEAGAMGKPIITTDNVGCRETVDHGINGFLCKPKSTDSLIIALEKMINFTHQERLDMGLASRSKIENEFDEKIVIDKYLSAINSLL
ncbi:MAG: glycosyltransferase family 4 protein [Plesiomonas sp.]|uniref:glycosyltransferase family 4 protein n=1 Tax=Plesiomonas sp. TaxID=2486279 RepID=UPI003F37B718